MIALQTKDQTEETLRRLYPRQGAAGNAVVIADRSPAQREILQRALTRFGFEALATADVAELKEWAQNHVAALIIADERMLSDEESLLPFLAQSPGMRVIGTHSGDSAAPAPAGLYARLAKPLNLEALSALCQQAIGDARWSAGAAESAQSLPLLGDSHPIREVRRVFMRLAQTNYPVLITGEAGTGVEYVAEALHRCGKRHNGPFIAAEAGDLNDVRLADILHDARGGSLYLKDIGDLSPCSQARLLHWLKSDQSNTCENSSAPRLIMSTRQDLLTSVVDGGFDEDLYYRLYVVPLHLPPLRERPEDLHEIVSAVMTLSLREGLPFKEVDPAAIAWLKRHDWPGNLLELRNFLRNVALLSGGDRITPDFVAEALALHRRAAPSSKQSGIPAPSQKQALARAVDDYLDRLLSDGGGLPGDIYDLVMREIERPLLRHVLATTRGNKLKAAEMLGLNRNTLRKKLERLGL